MDILIRPAQINRPQIEKLIREIEYIEIFQFQLIYDSYFRALLIVLIVKEKSFYNFWEMINTHFRLRLISAAQV